MNGYLWAAVGFAVICVASIVVEDARARRKSARLARDRIRAQRMQRRLDELHIIDGDRSTT